MSGQVLGTTIVPFPKQGETMPDHNPRKVGAVITFPEGVTQQQVYEFLAELSDDLEKDGSKFSFDSIQTGRYDPDCGSPVFYVP